MRIGIELNGVLRDTLKKIQQEYEKWYLENPFKEEEEKSEYEVMSELSSLEISKHLKFKDDDELYNFLTNSKNDVHPIMSFLLFISIARCHIGAFLYSVLP